jgi:hypothetical protein
MEKDMKPREIMEIRNLVDRAGEAIKYFEDHAFDNQKELLAAAREGFDVLKRQRDQSYAETESEAEAEAERVRFEGTTVIDIGYRALGNVEVKAIASRYYPYYQVVLSPYHRNGLEIRFGRYSHSSAEAIVNAILKARELE